jgi:hypothetical protein
MMIIGATVTNLNGTQVEMGALVGIGWDRDHVRPSPSPNGNSQLAGSRALGLPEPAISMNSSQLDYS